MAISTLDDLIAAFARMQLFAPSKVGAANQANVSYWGSSWTLAGSNLAASVPPTGSGEQCDDTTAGRILVQAPTGGRTLYLARFLMSPSQVATFYLMDRLVHTSGLSQTATTVQTVNTAALPSRAGRATVCRCGSRLYSSLSSTPATLTITYTNSAGVSGRTATIAVPISLKVMSAVRATLQSGDKGVQSVQSVQFSNSTGVAGNFGIVLARRIYGLPVMTATGAAVTNQFGLAMPVIDPKSCLFFINTSGSTTSPSFDAELAIIEG